jgi:rhomboid-like protein
MGYPTALRYAVINLSTEMAQRWLNSTESFRVCMQLVAVNTVVFVAWQVPRISAFMDRYFLQNPLSGRSIGLLTSVFSHRSLVHLAFNMIALSSFGW